MCPSTARQDLARSDDKGLALQHLRVARLLQQDQPLGIDTWPEALPADQQPTKAALKRSCTNIHAVEQRTKVV